MGIYFTRLWKIKKEKKLEKKRKTTKIIYTRSCCVEELQIIIIKLGRKKAAKVK